MSLSPLDVACRRRDVRLTEDVVLEHLKRKLVRGQVMRGSPGTGLRTTTYPWGG